MKHRHNGSCNGKNNGTIVLSKPEALELFGNHRFTGEITVAAEYERHAPLSKAIRVLGNGGAMSVAEIFNIAGRLIYIRGIAINTDGKRIALVTIPPAAGILNFCDCEKKAVAVFCSKVSLKANLDRFLQVKALKGRTPLKRIPLSKIHGVYFGFEER